MVSACPQPSLGQICRCLSHVRSHAWVPGVGVDVVGHPAVARPQAIGARALVRPPGGAVCWRRLGLWGPRPRTQEGSQLVSHPCPPGFVAVTSPASGWQQQVTADDNGLAVRWPACSDAAPPGVRRPGPLHVTPPHSTSETQKPVSQSPALFTETLSVAGSGLRNCGLVDSSSTRLPAPRTSRTAP